MKLKAIYLIFTLTILTVCLSACDNQQDLQNIKNTLQQGKGMYDSIKGQAVGEAFAGMPTTSNLSNSANDTITIASFNIQVFGKSKASKPEVMQTIVEIISQFDLVAIQEIRDKSGTAIVQLENMMDATGVDYNYIIGPRLGRTSSKEQYAYMYRVDRIKPGKSYTADDPMDIFHREPFIAEFKTINGNFDFILVQIHADPDTATEEINALRDVIITAIDKTGEKDIITLGDFNSDCNYHNELNRGTLNEDLYIWAIPNSADTNLAKSSCTYDRIIMTRLETGNDWTGDAGVYRFDQIHSLTTDQAKKVSDHYPVWAKFHTGKDKD